MVWSTGACGQCGTSSSTWYCLRLPQPQRPSGSLHRSLQVRELHFAMCIASLFRAAHLHEDVVHYRLMLRQSFVVIAIADADVVVGTRNNLICMVHDNCTCCMSGIWLKNCRGLNVRVKPCILYKQGQARYHCILLLNL